MKKILLSFALMAVAVAFGHAQTTVVSAQILDPANNPYRNAVVTVDFINNSSLIAKWNNFPLTVTTWTTSADSNGNFSQALPDLNFIGPATVTFYNFRICANTLVPPGQPTNPCFTYASPACPNVGCITGATITITAAIQAVSLPVPNALLTNVVTNPNGPQTISGPLILTGQLNCKSITASVKCVDSANTVGWGGSDIGAWINSASAAIGPNGGSGVQGEIWVVSPTQTNATTPISINDDQTLKIIGTIGVNSPILAGKFSALTCSSASAAGTAANIVATQAMANLIRMRVQDGSLETFYVNGCILNFGGFSVTRGVLDVTGANDRGSFGVQNPLIITNFTGTGAGLYMDDCPNGTCAANAGSGHSAFGSIWINPGNGGASTAPCVEFLHSNTSGGTPLGPWHFIDLECQLLNDTSTVGILFQNSCTSTCGANQWQFQSGIYADVIEVDNSCAACDGIKIDGVMGLDIARVYSFGGNATSNLVHVTNNANNVGIHVGKIFNISAGKAYLDDITTLSSTAKQIRSFTAGAQTTGSSAYNAFDETTFWGNLVGLSAMPAGFGGANRFGCYGNSTLNGISCTLNGNNDVFGFTQNSPFWIGTAGSGKFQIDTGGSAGFEYRLLNTSQSFTGITLGGLKVTNLLFNNTTPTIAAAGCGGAAASITANNGTAAFKIGVGTTPGSACTFTMPAAATGWNVNCNDITTQSTSVFVQKQTGAESTTSVTITNFSDVAVATAFVASDILKCTASAD